MARLLHFVNLSSKTLYIGLLRREGRLEIHIYDEPDPARIEVRSMQRIPIDVTPDVESCITAEGKFQYGINGHCSDVEMQLPTTAKPDGPVFRFHDRQP